MPLPSIIIKHVRSFLAVVAAPCVAAVFSLPRRASRSVNSSRLGFVAAPSILLSRRRLFVATSSWGGHSRS